MRKGQRARDGRQLRPHKLRRWLASSISMGLVLLLATSVTGAAASKTASVIKIGFVGELTGAFGSYGVPSYNASKLAIREINSAGGVTLHGKKYKFQLIECNDNTEATQTSACATQLVQTDHVSFMFGGLGAFGPIVAQVTNPAKVIYFASADQVADLLPSLKYTVLTLGSNQEKGTQFIKGLEHFYPGTTRVAAVMSNDGTPTAILPIFKQALKAYGGSIVATELFPEDATDVSPEVTAAIAANPQVIITSDDSQDLQLTLPAIASLDPSAKVAGYPDDCITATQLSFKLPYVGDALGPELQPPSSPVTKAFVAKYHAAYPGPLPAAMTATLYNYDYYFLLAKAIGKAQTYTNAKAVMSALQSTTYSGVVGTISIGSSRYATYGTDICYTNNGKEKVTHINPK